ncbi:MAG: serine/threonine-protein kinase, partial [Verrucomicrobiota bacterium]
MTYNPFDQAPPSSPEHQVDGYHILESLGEGGMGIVYKAEDLSDGRVVAIKFLKQEALADLDFVERFKLEGDILRDLGVENSGIVPVYGQGANESGYLYLVMKYLEGGTLQDILNQDQPLKLREVKRFMVDICSAIRGAHQVAVLHRDLKPSNIFITSERKIVILDFGLARDFNPSDVGGTSIGVVAGTRNYIAPECQKNGIATATEAADVFAIGVIFRQLLAKIEPHSSINEERERLLAVAEKASRENIVDRYRNVPDLLAAIGEEEVQLHSEPLEPVHIKTIDRVEIRQGQPHRINGIELPAEMTLEYLVSMFGPYRETELAPGHTLHYATWDELGVAAFSREKLRPSCVISELTFHYNTAGGSGGVPLKFIGDEICVVDEIAISETTTLADFPEHLTKTWNTKQLFDSDGLRRSPIARDGTSYQVYFDLNGKLLQVMACFREERSENGRSFTVIRECLDPIWERLMYSFAAPPYRVPDSKGVMAIFWVLGVLIAITCSVIFWRTSDPTTEWRIMKTIGSLAGGGIILGMLPLLFHMWVFETLPNWWFSRERRLDR